MTRFEKANLGITLAGILVGIVVAIIYGLQLRQMRVMSAATKASVEIATQSLAITQRGYVQISDFVVAVGEARTTVFYRLTVDGPTYVDIESGEIRLSIDDPPLKLEDRNAGLYTAKIKSQRIIPRQQGLQMAEFAPLTKEQQNILLKGQPLKIFYAGDIQYRDAFKGTPRHHRVFGYSVFGNKTEPLDMSILVRNEETDEDVSEQGQRPNQ